GRAPPENGSDRAAAKPAAASVNTTAATRIERVRTAADPSSVVRAGSAAIASVTATKLGRASAPVLDEIPEGRRWDERIEGIRHAAAGLRCNDPHVPRTVLIVDDHAHFRRLARRVLEAGGFSVVGEAADGASALAAASELRPQLVVLDVMLPDLDGIAVA